ncbi:hypothetical protein ACFWWS_38750, partial [Streptomyces sp. NPDC059083]
APGIAATLRQLPLATTHSEWPRLLLREYARLHLLTAAHARLDALSPGLRASVRTHIGYPTPADTVRAEPAVRDRWLVLGIRITTEDGLYTRRVWLRGRASGRWALLVDHHYGSPAFPNETPAPGCQVDANLHFYPSAAPPRALWGDRHEDIPEPFTTIPLHMAGSPDRNGTIAAALAEQARALGADPFLRSWPVLLAEVVPVRGEKGWYIAESGGDALPVSTAEGEPWRLLGLSGGHPVTVIGEWTVDGLVPVAALAAGTMVDVGVAQGNPMPIRGGVEDTASAELVSAALVGTARRQADLSGLASPVAAATTALTGDRAAVLLESIALQDCFARGGVSATSAERSAAAADDERRLLPVAAGARLTHLPADNSPFLDEWFALAGPRDFRAPYAMV